MASPWLALIKRTILRLKTGGLGDKVPRARASLEHAHVANCLATDIGRNDHEDICSRRMLGCTSPSSPMKHFWSALHFAQSSLEDLEPSEVKRALGP